MLKRFRNAAQLDVPPGENPQIVRPRMCINSSDGRLNSAGSHSTVLLFQEDMAHVQHICTQSTHTPHTLYLTFLFFCLCVCYLGTFPSPPLSLVFFFSDWPASTLISISHYLLEYSGECFQLLPFQLLQYPTWTVTFKFLEVLQLFSSSRSRVRAVDFFQGHLLRAGPGERRRSREGGGMVEKAGLIHLEFVESNPCTWI